MQKGYSPSPVIILILVALAGLGVVVSKSGIVPGFPAQKTDTVNITEDTEEKKQMAERANQIPEEYAIYQDYLRVVGNTYTVTEEVDIDAEVVSIAPSPEGFYPKITGSVKINKFTVKEKGANPNEGAGNAGTANTGTNTTVPNQGLGGQTKGDYPPLKEGQEVPALFLLTDKPVRVKYLPYGAGTAEKSSATGPMENTGQVVSNALEPGQDKLKHLIYEDGVLTFAIKVGNYSKLVVKTLPGLKAGDRFTATVRYNGQVFIEEYFKLGDL